MSHTKRLLEKLEDASRPEELVKNKEIINRYLNDGNMNALPVDLQNVILDWEHEEIESSSDFPPLPED